MMSVYKLIDHTADIGIEVYGNTLQDLFAHAGFALFDIITDMAYVGTKEERSISITGIDREQLLVNWLSELLYLHDIETLLFRQFNVLNINEDCLNAVVSGEKFVEGKHSIKTEVKAVTHHDLSIKQEKGRWKARIIFDL